MSITIIVMEYVQCNIVVSQCTSLIQVSWIDLHNAMSFNDYILFCTSVKGKGGGGEEEEGKRRRGARREKEERKIGGRGGRKEGGGKGGDERKGRRGEKREEAPLCQVCDLYTAT